MEEIQSNDLSYEPGRSSQLIDVSLAGRSSRVLRTAYSLVEKLGFDSDVCQCL